MTFFDIQSTTFMIFQHLPISLFSHIHDLLHFRLQRLTSWSPPKESQILLPSAEDGLPASVSWWYQIWEQGGLWQCFESQLQLWKSHRSCGSHPRRAIYVAVDEKYHCWWSKISSFTAWHNGRSQAVLFVSLWGYLDCKP